MPQPFSGIRKRMSGTQHQWRPAAALLCGLMLWAVVWCLKEKNLTDILKIASDAGASHLLPLPLNGTEQNATAYGSEHDMKRDGDGCYHVFLDVGANIGVHGRFLFEPDKYPLAKRALGIFNREFGRRRDNRDFCSFEIEPNPRHYPKLMAKSVAYKAKGWRYEVMNVAAGDRDGFMEFKHNRDTNSEEWGFSVKQLVRSATTEKIPTIHLAKWIEEHVIKRKIPPLPHGDYGDIGPKVIMKMDIEGSEFIVLPDLILSGVICGIDFIFGEFHQRFAPLNFTGQRVPLTSSIQATELKNIISGIIPSSRNCKTRFSELDDESYLHDGMPLPLNKTELGLSQNKSTADSVHANSTSMRF